MRIECGVNQICNAQCEHCNRAIGLARFKELEMTAEQMGRAASKMMDQRLRIIRLTLGGGEPVMNPELQGIIDEAAGRLPDLKDGRVLTNDMPHTKEKRAAIKLPHNFRWVPSPLRDPFDAKSGKDSHEPFFISPKDLGMRSKWSQCRVKGWCGKGLDACGWSMCGIAGTLGRLLGIDPYSRDGQTSKEVKGICEHCVYGLKEKEVKGVFRAAVKGKIPNFTETYVEGLKRHRKNPMVMERL